MEGIRKKGEWNLTEGKPEKVILQFAIPILLTTLLQNLYTTIDTIIIGQFVGKHALAGVGSTGAINFLIIGFFSVCFASPLAWLFADFFLVPAYFWTLDRLKKQVREQN